MTGDAGTNAGTWTVLPHAHRTALDANRSGTLVVFPQPWHATSIGIGPSPYRVLRRTRPGIQPNWMDGAGQGARAFRHWRGYPMAITTTTHAQLGEEHGLAGGWDEHGPWRVRPLVVEWFEKDLLMRELAGATTYSGTFGSGSWTRVLPYQDPEDPTLYVDSITWQPEGRLLTTYPVISYTHAIVVATFRRPVWNYQPSDDPMNFNSIDPSVVLPPYCSYHIEFGSDRVDIPNSSIKYLADGLTVPATWGKRMLTAELQLTFHKYPLSPLPIIRQYADTANSQTFLGCDPETVRFAGGTIDRQPNNDGSMAQDVILNFKWRKISWNKGPRPDGYTFDYVVDKVTNAKLYDLVDHNNILTYFTPAAE